MIISKDTIVHPFLKDKNKIGNEVVVKNALKGEVMMCSFNYMNSAEKIYLIVSGLALIRVESKLSSKPFYSFVSKDQLFGVESLIEENKRPKEIYYNVVAQTNVEYLIIDRQFFLDCVYTEPSIYLNFLVKLIEKISFLSQAYQLMNEKVSIRIVNTLIELMSILNIYPNKKGIIIFPKKITQEFIANYTNASIARTSIVFKELEKKKLIKRRPIRIIDLEELKLLQNEY